MIHSLRSLVGDDCTTTQTPDGRWVRCAPMPFRGGLFDRMRDAWAILTERAVAVRWPEPGELEDALSPSKVTSIRSRPAA